jgi:EmrB/QacA subfamily drug resistance transporter
MRARLKDPAYVNQRRWLTLVVICIGLMVITLDNTILNVAIPTLARPISEGGLGATTSQLQWIVDGYTIVFAGLLLTCGSLGDRFGRYRLLTTGLIVFGTGSFLSAMATSPTMLMGTRALMGIGGACIMPATLSIITNVFTDPVERGKAIGVWAGVSALGVGLGPITGGILLSHFWWGSVFLVNVPIAITALVLGYFLIPESRDPEAPKLDPLGALLSIAALGTLLWAIIEAPTNGWGSTETLAGFVVGAALLAAFLYWELHYSSPMLDIHFFKNPRFSAASGAISLTFFALYGTIFLLTQYLQSVLGYSTVEAGAVLLPQAAALMITAPLSALLVQRVGNKLVVGAGLVLVSLSLFSFLLLTPHSTVWAIIGVTVLMGLGMGNVMAPATDSIMGSLPRAKAGVGSAMNDTTRQVGGAVGVAVLGSILTSRYASQIAVELGHKVPAGLAASVDDNVSHAVAVANLSPQGHPYRETIITAAHTSFMSGLHAATVVAGLVTVIAAICVFVWLPAQARPHPDGTDPTDVDHDTPPTVSSGARTGATTDGVTVDVTEAPAAAEPEELVGLVERARSAEGLRAEGSIPAGGLAEGRP